jgi:XTP/dITP diphosphohydrolase
MSRPANRLVVATHNRGKLEELRALLAGLPVEVIGVAELLREPPVVVEDGATFEANAVKKARAIADVSMCLSLADDSGLEVDALDGRPGVRSARFAHERATDAENNAALLAALEALSGGGGAIQRASPEGFRARFRCVLALVDPFTNGGEPHVVEGACEGTIAPAPRGSGGFGYDPLFVVAGSDRTMAELTADEKNHVSHRARAFAALAPVLDQVLQSRSHQVARVTGSLVTWLPE